MKFNKVVKGGLAGLMAMSLAACSSDNGTAAGSTSGAGTTDGAVTLKLGGSGPLTGAAAQYGNCVKNAAALAVEEINASDEYTVKFELDFQDDEADGEKAVSAFNQLLSDGMQVSLATVTSGAGQAVSALYQEQQIFAITPSGSSTSIIYADGDAATQPYGNVFQMCFTDPNQGTASADYLAEHTELGSKIAVIWKNDDNYSTGLHDNFVAEAALKGLNIVSDTTFTTDTSTDFSTQVTAAKAAGADIVFLPIYYAPASQILTTANAQDYTPVFFGCDGMDGILTQEGFDATLAEGLYMLTPYSADSTDPRTAAFTKAYQDKYGETPNQFGADAYDCVYAIEQAAMAAGVTADMSNADICAALVEQFTTMTYADGVTGKDITWSKDGAVSKAPNAVVIQNGEYVTAD